MTTPSQPCWVSLSGKTLLPRLTHQGGIASLSDWMCMNRDRKSFSFTFSKVLIVLESSSRRSLILDSTTFKIGCAGVARNRATTGFLFHTKSTHGICVTYGKLARLIRWLPWLIYLTGAAAFIKAQIAESRPVSSRPFSKNPYRREKDMVPITSNAKYCNQFPRSNAT